MTHTYSCQKKAAEKRDKIVFITENTTIKKGYLMGLDNATYKNAFRQMQEMAHHVYSDMTTNFAEYGIKAETDKDGHFKMVRQCRAVRITLSNLTT